MLESCSQRSRIWVPAPMLGDSKPLLTLAPSDPMAFVDLSKYLTARAHTHTDIFTHLKEQVAGRSLNLRPARPTE